jgi:hypothetical protein
MSSYEGAVQDLVRDPGLSDQSRGRLVGAMVVLLQEVHALHAEVHALHAEVHALRAEVNALNAKLRSGEKRPGVTVVNFQRRVRRKVSRL